MYTEKDVVCKSCFCPGLLFWEVFWDAFLPVFASLQFCNLNIIPWHYVYDEKDYWIRNGSDIREGLAATRTRFQTKAQTI